MSEQTKTAGETATESAAQVRGVTLKEIIYTYAQLCEAIEKANGRIVEPFSFFYPTDYRCKPTLRIRCKTEKADFFADEADDPMVVSRLLGLEVVAFSWNQYDSKVLKVVVRGE